MMTFFENLIQLLNRETPDWQENSVILLDNATWNKGEQIIRALEHHGVRVMFSSPYSYSTAPIELLYSALKLGDLNPERKPSGKKLVIFINILILLFIGLYRWWQR